MTDYTYTNGPRLAVGTASQPEQECAARGHATPDTRGRCFLCGTPFTEDQLYAFARAKVENGQRVETLPKPEQDALAARFQQAADRVHAGIKTAFARETDDRTTHRLSCGCYYCVNRLAPPLPACLEAAT
jgi:hypothetical protein